MFFKLKYLTFLDHVPCAVQDSKRLAAYLIDWFLSSLCLNLPLCMAWMWATRDLDQMEKVNLFRLAAASSVNIALLAGVFGLVLFLWYMVFVPWKVTPGQTPGKRVMGIALKRVDGEKLGLKDLLIRQVAGILLLEGVLYSGSSLLQDMVSLASGLNFTGILLYASLAVTIGSLVAALLVPSRRMLHDYLAGTTLCEAASTRQDAVI